MRGELDWIVMKALEKDRSRRYDTANGLAKDVQRYLAGDAVEACPPTLGYRLRKFYRKHRGAISAAGAFGAVLLVATGVSLAFGILARLAERRAIEQEHIAAASAKEAIESKTIAQRERDEAIAARDRLAGSVRPVHSTGGFVLQGTQDQRDPENPGKHPGESPRLGMALPEPGLPERLPLFQSSATQTRVFRFLQSGRHADRYDQLRFY